MRLPIRILTFILFSLCSCISATVFADGNSVDKVYHPYVIPTEIEIEWRGIFQSDKKESLDNQQTQRLGIGASFIENWFTEIYIIGETTAIDNFKTTSVEIEAIVQLTEQGEYSADWGLLFELERNFDRNITELAAALLVEKEWGRWVGALNAYIEFEKLDDENRSEIETFFATQLRATFVPVSQKKFIGNLA